MEEVPLGMVVLGVEVVVAVVTQSPDLDRSQVAFLEV